MIHSLVEFIIYLIILGVVVWLLLWLIDYVPLPEPFNRVGRVLVIVVGVLILILLLLNLAGTIGGFHITELSTPARAAIGL
jgi:hypothetical protein